MEALKEEIKKLSALSLFFFISFGYILIIVKLFLEEYSINFYAFSKVIIGALVAAKTVAIVDALPLERKLVKYPRYLIVLLKTFFYTIGVIIIGIIERMIDAYFKKQSLSSLFEGIDRASTYHFFAIIFCIAIVFFIHNVFEQIDIYMGKGRLAKFFFSPPKKKTKT